MVITVTLLSNGQMKNIPKTLKFNEWSMKDIKEMSKSEGPALDQVLNSVLSRTLVRDGLPEGFTIESLTQQDRTYIMMVVRASTISRSYKFDFTHTLPRKLIDPDSGAERIEECGNKIGFSFDLITGIKYEEIPKEYYDNVAVILPSGKVVRVKIPSFDELRAATNKFQEITGLDVMDSSTDEYEATTFWTTVMFSGVENKKFESIAEALAMVEGSSAQDSAALIDIAKYFRGWGPNLQVEGKCERCGKAYSFPFPFLASFFFDQTEFKFDLKSAIRPKPAV